MAERARGKKGVFNSLKQLLSLHPLDPAYWLGIGHVNNQSTAEEVKQLFQEIGFTKLFLFDVSPVLGIHAGEAPGVYFIPKRRLTSGNKTMRLPKKCLQQ